MSERGVILDYMQAIGWDVVEILLSNKVRCVLVLHSVPYHLGITDLAETR